MKADKESFDSSWEGRKISLRIEKEGYLYLFQF